MSVWVVGDRVIKDDCLPAWACSGFNDCDLAEKKWCWMFDRSLGVVLVDILEESNSDTELLRFLGHMAHCFRGARANSSLEGERGVLVVVFAQLLRGNEVLIKVAPLAERGEFSLTHELFSLGMSFAGSLSRQTYCGCDSISF
ncbi:hypothetical protein F2Q70_00022449 [Brassica cretica]|uniref:Uncharacterized protein n=1 Tax=Brassica cretica TaxID=69181 RepID=A0A8S9GTA0_BRACR|nr:hypothetical protein F2Q70_00022449 [Brassica cretica]